MHTLESFCGTWTIKWWGLNVEMKGGLPVEGFGAGNTLEVSTGDGETGGCKLAWSDGKGKGCSMGLPFQEGKLEGGDVTIDFAEETISNCSVTVHEIGSPGREIRLLVGILESPRTFPFGTGNAGTFVAQAGGPVGDDGSGS